MSKYVNVPNGDYRVRVEDGGSITLDTGFNEGQVVITGDLLVQGTTTTVESTVTTIADNIITLNAGETANGINSVNGNDAGLEIDRGTLSNAYFVFDEDISWRRPSDGVLVTGGFVVRDQSANLVGLRTNSISTGGGDLYLINSGNGVVSVSGTVDYELNVTDDDDITNKKYVDDAISFAFATVFLRQIGDGSDTITSISIDDEENTGSPSVITVAIDGTTVSQVYRDRWEFEEVRIAGTVIETISSDEDLVLRAPGTGSVRVEDVLEIDYTPHTDDGSLEPTAPTEGIKIYTSDQYSGKSGIYFVNAEDNRDELVSKNRALLFGMLF
jgi:hypothetical protein